MLEIEKAEGLYMYDKSGNRIIDLISGIGVSNVGHRHPKVIEAIKTQLDKHLHLMVYGEFVQSPQVKLAKAITDTLPAHLSQVYFLNSGSEAVEGALKLSKRFTGRTELISCFNAYHGSSHGALSVTGNEGFKRKFRPLLPGVKHLVFGKTDDLAIISERTAAVIIETVQGEAGVRIASTDYFKQLRKRCDETGTLLILDEIQTGFGRTGKFWGFEHYAIAPDILVCAKGMGGGMPIGAFISSQEIMSVLKENPILGHISTFGGHPVSCEASYATLQVINDDALLASVDQKAQRFIDRLRHPAITEIRNKGLMMAVEFESFDVLIPIIEQLLKDGLLSDWFLFCDNAMRIAPPLIISEEQIDESCDMILKAIEGAAR